jgi:hypothetical protein
MVGARANEAMRGDEGRGDEGGGDDGGGDDGDEGSSQSCRPPLRRSRVTRERGADAADAGARHHCDIVMRDSL